jgi:hypothetical protein
MKAPDELLTIRDFLGDDIGIKGGTVVDQELPVSVEKHSAERGHILEPDPVVLRLNPVRGPLEDLEKPQPQQKHEKHCHHDERQ